MISNIHVWRFYDSDYTTHVYHFFAPKGFRSDGEVISYRYEKILGYTLYELEKSYKNDYKTFFKELMQFKEI